MKAGLILLTAACLGLCAARACEVPVYRYALERWAPDDYHLVVFHRGAPDPGWRRALDEVEAQSRPDRPDRLNVLAQAVDLATAPDHPLARACETELGEGLPRAVLLFPDRINKRDDAPAPIPVVAWSGPADAAAIRSWVESPVCRETVERLLSGDTLVWLVRECGRDDEDQAARTRLDEALAALRPPEGREPVRHAVLRLDPERAGDAGLIGLLLRTEPDLAALADKPMVFPVFGRGRALYALVGAGINDRTVAEACEYLTGDCSCEVKADNPGVDLPLAADWSRIADGRRLSDEAAPPLTGITPAAGAPAERPAPDAADLEAELRTGGPSLLMNVLAATALLALAVLAGAGLMKKNRKG